MAKVLAMLCCFSMTSAPLHAGVTERSPLLASPSLATTGRTTAALGMANLRAKDKATGFVKCAVNAFYRAKPNGRSRLLAEAKS
jgi:GGDEF domain-containing protein